MIKRYRNHYTVIPRVLIRCLSSRPSRGNRHGFLFLLLFGNKTYTIAYRFFFVLYGTTATIPFIFSVIIMTFVVQDHYFHRAKKEGYLARSVFKLEEIDQKFGILTNTYTVLDIGCAPGSRLQYLDRTLNTKTGGHHTIVGVDIKESAYRSSRCHPYVCDASDRDLLQTIITNHNIEQFDTIVSDMAPNTIGHKASDGIRSIGLITKTLWIYETYLKQGGSFVIKVFMGPGFQELYNDLRDQYGGAKRVKIFKPKACRKDSKETYIVRFPDVGLT